MQGFLLDADSIRKLRSLNQSDSLEDKAKRSRPQLPQLNIPWGKWGTLDEDLLAGDSATMSVHDLDDDTHAPSDTGDSQEVYDVLLGTGKQLPSGAIVVALRMGNHFIVIASDTCPEEQP